ncbi:MAG: hypothetical protein K6F49_04235 [Saccharofermentans sp.]|nr:hypothetical protein [Saccharofermentans sp.]
MRCNISLSSFLPCNYNLFRTGFGGDDPTSFDQVLSAMSSAELVVIDGADHFYEGEYGEETVEDACDKIASWE